MTMNLYWKPAHTPPDGDLGDGIKFILRDKFGGHVDVVLDLNDISYLEGICAAGRGEVVQDAERLISAIKQHDAIRVYEM